MEKFGVTSAVNESPEALERANQKKLAMEYLKRHEEFTKKLKSSVSLANQLQKWRNEGQEVANDDPMQLEFTRLSAESDELMKQYLAVGEQLTEETKNKYLTLTKDADGNEFGYNSNGNIEMKK